jgi:hypothetical protein
MDLVDTVFKNKEKIDQNAISDGKYSHLFLSIANDNNIFHSIEEKILGLMIFAFCQNSLFAGKVGNLKLIDYYRNRVNLLCSKLDNEVVENIDAAINTYQRD